MSNLPHSTSPQPEPTDRERLDALRVRLSRRGLSIEALDTGSYAVRSAGVMVHLSDLSALEQYATNIGAKT